MIEQNSIAYISEFLAILAIFVSIASTILLKIQFSAKSAAFHSEILSNVADISRLKQSIENIEVENYLKIKKKVAEIESDLFAYDLKTKELDTALKTHYSKWAAKLGKIMKDQEAAEAAAIPEGLYPQGEMFNGHAMTEQPPQPQRKPFNLG